MSQEKFINIVIPMAGKGSRFQEAGYTFPKPLIDIKDRTMIEVVIDNLKPSQEYRFIFIAQKEHCEKYDVYNVLKRATNNKFELIQIDGITEGAACTVLLAKQYINTDNALIIANSDQYIDIKINDFITTAQTSNTDGLIMTFEASHPKWSYARMDKNGKVLEVAEKQVISSHATVGIYYFEHGKDFIEGAESMIKKGVRHNNEFYVCPVYNELILNEKDITIYEIPVTKMHGLGTPEDLNVFMQKLDTNQISI
ncbi:MAG: glycosyltransferase family 2 protein [Minisyncoccota bacterium]